MLTYNYLKTKANLYVFSKHQILKGFGGALLTNLELNTSQLSQ